MNVDLCIMIVCALCCLFVLVVLVDVWVLLSRNFAWFRLWV
jgi:hypothetical protein